MNMEKTVSSGKRACLLGGAVCLLLQAAACAPSLFQAVRKQDIFKTRKALASGADPNRIDTASGENALHIAARLGERDIAVLLLQKGARVDTPTRQPTAGTNQAGWTALLLACHGGHLSTAALLLTNKADPTRTTPKDSRSPLHLAVERADARLARLLLAHGARVSQKDKLGHTPLRVLLQSNPLLGHSHTETAKVLLENGARLSTQPDQHWNPFECAFNHYLAIPHLVHQMLKAGANVNQRFSDHSTPLLRAIVLEDEELIRKLVRMGADIKARTRQGRTALMLVAARHLPQTLTFLLDKGADPKAVDHKGMSALHHAVKARKPDQVRILLARGAPVNLRDKEGLSPIYYAGMHQELLCILRQAGGKF